MKKFLGLIGALGLTASTVATSVAMTPIVQNKDVQEVENLVEDFKVDSELNIEEITPTLELTPSNFWYTMGNPGDKKWQFVFEKNDSYIMYQILKGSSAVAQIMAWFPNLAPVAKPIATVLKSLTNWFWEASQGNGIMIKFTYVIPYDVIYL